MSLRDAAENEALLAEAEYQNLEELADRLWARRHELRAAMLDLGLNLLEDFRPTSDDLHCALKELQSHGPPGSTSWTVVQLANPGIIAKTLAWVSRNGWPGYDPDGRFISPSKEEPMAKKKTEGKHTLEVTERELYELRQAVRLREHDLEKAHDYMEGKGLSTGSPDERLIILRGSGPDRPGLMHRLGFVESEIKSAPELEDQDQLELVENDDGEE